MKTPPKDPPQPNVDAGSPAGEPLPPPDVTLKGFLPRDPLVGWWTLRGQLTLAAVLYGTSIIVAVGLATQRSFIEQTVKEVYVVPANCSATVKLSFAGQLTREQFERLAPASRRALFDAWMIEPSPGPAGPPVTLTEYDSEFYLSCCERSLVCGDAAQQLRALEFVKAAQRREAVPMLEKYVAFLKRQQREEWATRVGAVVAELDRKPR